MAPGVRYLPCFTWSVISANSGLNVCGSMLTSARARASAAAWLSPDMGVPSVTKVMIPSRWRGGRAQRAPTLDHLAGQQAEVDRLADVGLPPGQLARVEEELDHLLVCVGLLLDLPVGGPVLAG